MRLLNKKILITAGPTWVAIDRVRVISNVASGETGILLAEKFSRLGGKVTLLLGPAQQSVRADGYKLIRFRFFDELKETLLRELRRKRYDIVIHSAAVSDYRLKKQFKDKIPSYNKFLKLELIPTEKLISLVKKINPDLFLAGFKFAPGKSDVCLLKEARGLIEESNADLVVANRIDSRGYCAYIVDKKNSVGPLKSRNSLVAAFGELFGQRF